MVWRMGHKRSYSEVLEVSEFTLYKHHYTTCVDASGTYQATLSAEHTLANLFVSPFVLATTHRGVELAEVKVGNVACGARCSARATTDAGL